MCLSAGKEEKKCAVVHLGLALGRPAQSKLLISLHHQILFACCSGAKLFPLKCCFISVSCKVRILSASSGYVWVWCFWPVDWLFLHIIEKKWYGLKDWGECTIENTDAGLGCLRYKFEPRHMLLYCDEIVRNKIIFGNNLWCSQVEFFGESIRSFYTLKTSFHLLPKCRTDSLAQYWYKLLSFCASPSKFFSFFFISELVSVQRGLVCL